MPHRKDFDEDVRAQLERPLSEFFREISEVLETLRRHDQRYPDSGPISLEGNPVRLPWTFEAEDRWRFQGELIAPESLSPARRVDVHWKWRGRVSNHRPPRPVFYWANERHSAWEVAWHRVFGLEGIAPRKGMAIRPACGEHLCVNPGHLRWQPRLDGRTDSRKLTAKQEHDLYVKRLLYMRYPESTRRRLPPADRASIARLARTYGVSEWTVRAVLRREEEKQRQ